MDDVVFVAEEDRLLHKRDTPMREAQLKKLEHRALYEECEEADGEDSFQHRARSPRRGTRHG